MSTYSIKLYQVGDAASTVASDVFGPAAPDPFTEFATYPGVFLQDELSQTQDKLVGFRRVPGSQTLQFCDISGTFLLSNLATKTGLAGVAGDVSIDLTSTTPTSTVNSVGGVTAPNIAAAYALTSAARAPGLVFASASSGASGPPGWRSLVASDIPPLPATGITGLAASATVDATNASNLTSGQVPMARLPQFVTSVSLALPSMFVTGPAVTSSGTLVADFVGQPAAFVLAGPASGSGVSVPTFRALVATDIPNLPATQILGLKTSATLDTTNASNITSGSMALARVSSQGGSEGQFVAVQGGQLAFVTLTEAQGTVTSVGLSMPTALYSSNGNPITSNGALAPTLATQAAGTVFAAPLSGQPAAPTFRALGVTDLPAIPATKLTGLAASATTDTTTADNIASGSLALARISTAGATLGQTLTLTSSGLGYVTPTEYINELDGDVTASGGGPVVATVVKVGGALAANVASAVTTVQGSQNANLVFASPEAASGTPIFRSLLAADIPTLGAGKITGLAPSATSDTTIASNITSGSLALARLSTAGATNGQVIGYNGTSAVWVTPAMSSGGTGTVTSVALSAPSIFGVAGSPVTASGTLALTLAAQPVNMVFAGPGSGSASGVPTFRVLSQGDLPTVPLTKIDTSSATNGYFLSYNGTSVAWVPAPSGGGSATFPLQAPVGDGATPSYGFGTTNTGMSTDTNGNLQLYSGGTLVLSSRAGYIFPAMPQASVPGTNIVCTYGFANNGGTGMYSSATGTLMFAASSRQVMTMTQVGVTSNLPVSVTTLLLPSANQPGGIANTGQIFYSDGAKHVYFVDSTGASWQLDQQQVTGGGTSNASGTVTSVALSAPSSVFGVTGSPITANGTLMLNLATQAANSFWAGPTSGTAAAPTFRSIGVADLPTIPATQLTGLAPSATTDATVASNITSGILPAARLSGAYASITGIGTLASGSVPASLVTGLAPSATSDTTIADNITSGTLASGRLSGQYGGITGVGNLSSGIIPVGLVTGLAPSATSDTTNATNITSGSLALARISTSGASVGTVLTYNGSVASWQAPATSGITALTGDVTASGTGSVVSSVAKVGGQTASAVATATSLVNTAVTGHYVLIGAQSAATQAPTFRALIASDLPTIPAGQITGLAPSATTDATIASNITSGTLPAARLPAFVASGSSHAQGAVPDPGATAGSTRFLCENATWTTLLNGFGAQSALLVLAGPTTGSAVPTFRALTAADIPPTPITLIQPSPGTNVSQTLSVTQSGALIQAGGGSTLFKLTVSMPTDVPSTQAARYTAINTSTTATLKLSIPSGMVFYPPAASGVAGPTTYTTTTSNASVEFMVIGTTQCHILSTTGTWSNP